MAMLFVRYHPLSFPAWRRLWLHLRNILVNSPELAGTVCAFFSSLMQPVRLSLVQTHSPIWPECWYFAHTFEPNYITCTERHNYFTTEIWEGMVPLQTFDLDSMAFIVKTMK